MGIPDDRFWAHFLGVDPADWMTPGVSVAPHVGLRGYRGFWCFRRGQTIVVSAPEPWVERLNQITAECHADDLLLPQFWLRALPGDFERAVGPAFQGCLDPTKFKARSTAAVRLVRDADALALDEFRAACSSDWNMPDDARLWRHAYFEDGIITALAAYRNWSDSAGDPCVITRPDGRGCRRGSAVTSAVVAAALSHERLLLYQTLESNLPAVQIALSLGYERYANHLAIRLCRESPET